MFNYDDCNFKAPRPAPSAPRAPRVASDGRAAAASALEGLTGARHGYFWQKLTFEKRLPPRGRSRSARTRARASSRGRRVPPVPPRTKWTRRVPHPVLIGLVRARRRVEGACPLGARPLTRLDARAECGFPLRLSDKGDGRGREQACPLSRGGGERRVQLVRGETRRVQFRSHLERHMPPTPRGAMPEIEQPCRPRPKWSRGRRARVRLLPLTCQLPPLFGRRNSGSRTPTRSRCRLAVPAPPAPRARRRRRRRRQQQQQQQRKRRRVLPLRRARASW
jgi:hypothetical protein